MLCRAGETKKTWFRSQRYFHTAEGWFYTTREHTQEGPFGSQKEAENELTLYIRRVSSQFFV